MTSIQICLARALLAISCILTVFLSMPVSAENAELQGRFFTAAGTLDHYTNKQLLVAGTVAIPANTKTDSTIILGGDVSIAGTIAEQAIIAGGNIAYSGKIGERGILVGGKVVTSTNSYFGKHTVIVGGDVNLAGNFSDDLTVLAGKVLIDGAVHGNVSIMGGTIQVGPNARIAGELKFLSPVPIKVDSSAVIKGGVSKWQRNNQPSPERVVFTNAMSERVASISGFYYFSIFVLGLLLILIFPGFSKRSSSKLVTRPWATLGLGFLTLVLTPVIIILLFITVFGIPFALLLLFLYIIAFLISYICIALSIGILPFWLYRKGALPSGRLYYILALILGILALFLIKLIPGLGFWLIFLAIIFGFGALILGLHQTYNKAERISS